MTILTRVLELADRLRAPMVARAHCDLPCGVYDPAQARIEAESVYGIQQKFQDSDDPVFRERAIQIKEERAELVKHHLMVLWIDFFTPDHRQQFPNLDDLFWRAIRAASDAKKSLDPADGQKLIGLVDEVSDIFWQTEKAKDAGVYPPG